jgi:A/G-specific adenine glycosylase
MHTLPTLQALAQAAPATVLKLWEGLGYYTRARNLQAAARCLIDHHASRFPKTPAALLALPGVGRYTAGAIGSIAFNQPVPILDGNLVRVLSRLFCIRDDPRHSRTRIRLWGLAESLVRQAAALVGTPRNPAPRKRWTRLPLRASDTCSHLNQGFMELGATLCTPRWPRCGACPLRRWCRACQRGCANALPTRPRRLSAIHRHEVALVVERSGRFLVRPRPEQTVNAQLWEFPTVVLTPPARAGARRVHTGSATRPAAPVAADWAAGRRTLVREYPGLEGRRLEPLCIVRHAITRYRITLQVFRTQVDGHVARGSRASGLDPDCANSGLRWASRSELEALAFSAAHRKICAQLPK